MGRRSVVTRAFAAIALTVMGLTPAVISAPAAHAAVSALVAAPTSVDFQTIPVGQLAGQDVQVTNTGGAALTITNVTASGGLIDFLPFPAFNPNPVSCFNAQLVSNPIPAGSHCTLGLAFLPTHFGVRATTMTLTDSAGNTFNLTLSGTGVGGYYLAGASAEYATFGFAAHDFESGGIPLNQPVMGIAGTPDGDGFWLTAADGGVFTVGTAGFFGSTGNIRLNRPVVGMAATPSGHGYWLVASDGGIFTFGDAGFFGSTGNIRLNRPVVGMAATPSGHGYWLVASDGGIFTFGDAGFFGSTGNIRLNQPVLGMAATPSGHGYWLVASDGGIFTFGDAGFFGSTGNVRLDRPIVGMAASPTGRGYWLVASDGGIFTFGDVPFEGSLPGAGVAADDVIGMAPTTAPLFGPFLMAPASLGNRATAAASALGRVGSSPIRLVKPAAVAKH
jgi:ribosomal protein L24E